MFVGRKRELSLLESYLSHSVAKFIAITGRRRIGKSRLVREFAEGHRYFKFTGLAPSEDIDDQSQREEFARSLRTYFNLPPLKDTDWADLFDVLADSIEKSNKKTVVFFDEVSWMGMSDETFLPKLKNLWDDGFSCRSKFVFIICSSVSNWIEEKVLASTAFVGRVSHSLRLSELSLLESNQFFSGKGSRISAFERLQLMAITGGIPLYLENLDIRKTAEDNIKALCFTDGGLLVGEFDKIFHDVFTTKSRIYRDAVEALVQGPMDTQTLCEKIDVSPSKATSDALGHLVKAGFVKRDYTWDISKGNFGKLSAYRLSDNYMRFYLRYIQPITKKIKNGLFGYTGLSSLKQINTIMGLQFENLVMHNLSLILEELGLALADIAVAGPFFQTKTKRRAGCQIDLLIQTQQNTLFVCEIKFTRKPVGAGVIRAVEDKINALDYPKGFSVRPVLIHVGNVTEDLEDAQYFAKIINFSDLLD